MSVTKPSYQSYQSYVETVVQEPYTQWAFKQHPSYLEILENVGKEYGIQYLYWIEHEFPIVTFDILRKFVNINDKYGNANKMIFTTRDHRLLYCSPSSLRYLYHALILLTKFQASGCQHIVELGCGYGGLCLAVQILAPLFTNVHLGTYVMIDLPEPCALTRAYLQVHQSHIGSEIKILDDVKNADLANDGSFFLVSNYCFSALSREWQTKYRVHLVDHCSHGWIIWQTCFGDSVENSRYLLGKPDAEIIEEKPQTAPLHVKNYWVHF
jgi:hypothetical protein